MVKQKRKTVYVAKSTGRTWNTREEAIKDNIEYKKDIHYRYSIKAGNYKSPYKNYNIPFIPKKKITLTNAGLATGAVLSTNLLDSIAVNAERAGLPIKTAIGLATKESTLNNPTYDINSRAKISKVDRHELDRAKRQVAPVKAIQNIGVGDTKEGLLINYNPADNPYSSATTYILQKAKTWEDNLRMMRENEAYADRQAIRKQAQPSKSYLQAGFELYKRNPQGYNPGQPNYQQLVNKRAEEVWGSPEVQNWYKTYRKRRFEKGGEIMPKRSLENAGISDLFDGTSQHTQQMQLGSAYWKQQARKPIFTKELAKFNKKKAEESRQRINEFKKWAATKGKRLV